MHHVGTLCRIGKLLLYNLLFRVWSKEKHHITLYCVYVPRALCCKTSSFCVCVSVHRTLALKSHLLYRLNAQCTEWLWGGRTRCCFSSQQLLKMSLNEISPAEGALCSEKTALRVTEVICFILMLCSLSMYVPCVKLTLMTFSSVTEE